MKGKNLVILNVVLLVIAAFLAYKIYQVIMEPIQFERIKLQRFCAITERMEKVREAELAYKDVYGEFTGDWANLISFVDTGYITIYERKDSSFMYYNKRFQKDMNKDTVVVREIGKERVLDRFGQDFDPTVLKEVPQVEDVEFDLGAGKIERNGVTVPVFEVSVADTEIFKDLKSRFDQYIDKEHRYQIGSLTEATISGNYENTKCKGGAN
jgi:hypothetical protein